MYVPLRMNVLDIFAGNKPYSERRLLFLMLLLRTVTVVATSAVLGIYQLLLELAARGTGTSGQTTIAGRAEALPRREGCTTGDVEVDGKIGGIHDPVRAGSGTWVRK